MLGTNWPAGAVVSIKWSDGTEIGIAGVLPTGQFATQIRIPQNAAPGTSYKITATGGGLTATADVVMAIVYEPSFSVTQVGRTSIQYSGGGWPPGASYSITFDGRPLGITGVTSAQGTLGGSFPLPANAGPGVHTVTASSGPYSASAQLTI